MSRKLFILIACEESQVSCIAFRNLGCEAFSCDLQPCSGGHPEWHIQGDARSLLSSNCHFITEDGSYHTIKHWDLLLAHPPCTYLSAVSGQYLYTKNGFNISRYNKLVAASKFFYNFYNANIPYICIENPRPLRIAKLPSPSCVVSPEMFGSYFTKRTYLWLKNLPPVIPTCFRTNCKSFNATRSGSKNRSKSDLLMYSEIAKQFYDFILYDYETR